MALPVTVYRWDDPGAPQLPDNDVRPSNYITLLKKCLVEGYGDKTALGWTMPFERADGLAVVFRCSETEGSGSFMQIKCKTGADTLGGHVLLRAAPLMTEADPDFTTIANVSKQYAFGGERGITKWCLMGTSAGFYLFGIYKTRTTMMMGTYKNLAFFCGDIESFVPNDLSRFTVIAPGAYGDASSASWNTVLAYLGTATAAGFMHESNGGDFGKAMYLYSNFKTSQTTLINGVPSDFRVYNRPYLGIKGYHPTTVNTLNSDSVGIHVRESSLHPAYRGTLPGFIQTQALGYSDQTWPQTSVIGGKVHWLVHAAHNGACSFWVNMESWYD
ncbi:hypothetical protein [Shewanella woodyi]|uniref:hypothetical protein n=1 Tax=Shewanella woodyi TaxID=60961 RepID=UPI0007F97593|nr:hypothetical protein [Shewanella woodyi]